MATIQINTPKRPQLKTTITTSLQNAKHTPSGCWDFCQTTTNALCVTIGFLILLAISGTIPIAMIVVGAIYLDDCPVEPYIPIWLLVSGVFGLIRTAIYMINGIRLKLLQKREQGKKLSPYDPLSLLCSLIDLFLFAWMIAGSVWVFQITYPNFNREKPNYCRKGLYMFSFILLIIGWVLGAIVATSLCCFSFFFSCFVLALGDSHGNSQNASA